MRAIAICLLALTGCAPSLINGNEAGGLVSVRGTLNGQSKAMAQAETECRKYGKVARYKSTNEIRGTVSYDCVSAQ